MYKKSFISIWGGGLAGIFAFNLIKLNSFLSERIGSSNLIQYAVTCFVFVLASFIVYIFLQLKIFDNDFLINIICGISCISIMAFMYICWKQNVDVAFSFAGSYLWYLHPSLVIFAILAILTFWYHVVCENTDFEKGRGKKAQYGLFIFYMMVVFLSGYLNYFVEYLKADSYHGSAVFNSVYNVLHGVPYEEVSNSIYGNYAIFFIIPMRILGNGEYFDFSRIMCLITMVCTALGIYVIHNLTEKNHMRILCIVALLWNGISRGSNYWQVYPLRILCPILLIAWLVFLTKKVDIGGSGYKYIFYIGTYLLLTFSIVWNKESGVVCLIGYLVFLVYKRIAELFFSKDIKCIWKTLLECLVMTSTVFAAFIVVGLYNLFAAGKWITWKGFLFPLLTTSYMDSLVIELPKGIWPWMAVAFLFLGIIAAVTLKIICKEEIDSDEYIYVAAATMGLGLMTYFMNRAAYKNIDICYYEAIICIGGVYRFVKCGDYGRMTSTFMKELSLMVLIAFAAGVMLQLGGSLYSREDIYVSQKEILSLRDRIREDAEVDTYAFGMNIPELYSILGWETRSYTTDWADFDIVREAMWQKVCYDLDNEECIITDERVLQRYEDVAEYVNSLFYIDKTYIYENNDTIVFYLMKKKN